MKTLPLVALLWASAAAAPGTVVAQENAASQPAPGSEKRAKLKYKLDDKLKFIAGCWAGQIDRDTEVEEIWNNPTENLMTATTRYLRKGRATSFEFSKIVANDSTVTFAASSEGKPFDEYTMVQLVDEYVVFENPKKSFPQRISYRLASDGRLLPRNEGEGQNSIEVRLKKVNCPGT